MKNKLHTLWQAFIRTPIPVLCYSITILAWLMVSGFSLLGDSVAKANGTLSTKNLTAADFTLEDLDLLPNGNLQATSPDPKMFLSSISGKVRTLRFSAVYSKPAHEIDLYYTTKPDMPFSKDMRVWPVLQDDGSYLFSLPKGTIHALRLDPASALVDIRFEEIVLNEPVSPMQYFNPGWNGLALLLLLPAFASAVIRWGKDTTRHYWRKFSAKRRKPL